MAFIQLWFVIFWGGAITNNSLLNVSMIVIRTAEIYRVFVSIRMILFSPPTQVWLGMHFFLCPHVSILGCMESRILGKFPCLLMEKLLQGRTILLFLGRRLANLAVSIEHLCQELQVLFHTVPRPSRPIWSATYSWPLEVDLAIFLLLQLDEDCLGVN